MNREEFMRQLECLLMNIPENDRLDAIAYYNDYFDDAGVENEQKVIQELGSPEKVAEKIKEDLSHAGYEAPDNTTKPQVYTTTPTVSQPEKKKIPWALIIILLILTCPLWIGIVGGLFGGLIGIIAGLFGVLCGLLGAGIGLTFGGIGCMIGGFFTLSTLEGIISIGIGAIMTAIGLLFLLFIVWVTFKWLPCLVKAVIHWCKGLSHKEKGGNEI